MDFKSVTYFLTVAEELNFTKAAAKLRMSQPPLSSQIKALEDDLGTQLFIRGKRHLKLTQAGEMLYQRFREIQGLAVKTRADLATLDNNLTGHITIGQVEGRAPYITAHLIKNFHEEYPNVTYNLWNGSSDEVLNKLSNGLVDLAVVAVPFNNEKYSSVTLGREPWIAMIPKDHPLAQKPGKSIKLKELSGEPIMVPVRPSRLSAIHKWFESVHATANIICTLSNYTNASAMVEHEMGICIFPQTSYTPNPNIVFKLITEPAKIAEYCLVWNKKNDPLGVANAFVKFTQNLVDSGELERAHAKVKSEIRFPQEAEIL